MTITKQDMIRMRQKYLDKIPTMQAEVKIFKTNDSAVVYLDMFQIPKDIREKAVTEIDNNGITKLENFLIIVDSYDILTTDGGILK